ncbi:MAG: RluA family pseudouridine synthase [Candidatus Neomarinimicrobiota bacterium]
MINFQVSDLKDKGMRLDHYLVNNLSKYSRSHIQSFIKSGNILVNGERCKTGYSIDLDDMVQVDIPKNESSPSHLVPEKIDIEILYEDNAIIVINKPAGLVIHPGVGISTGTLVNGLIYHFKKLSNINGDIRPGIVHRLDRDTSGILVIAKTNQAHVHLANQFQKREIKKEYTALTWGIWKNQEGEINKSIARHKKDPTKFQINSIGKQSITLFKVEKRLRHFSIISFFPLTGRTHQIRIHSANCGHPIFGDNKYGGGKPKVKGFIPEYRSIYNKEMSLFDRHALHAKRLEFRHPSNDDSIIFEAPLPKEFINLITSIDL